MFALTLIMYATVRNVTVPAVISWYREVLRSVTLKYRPNWSRQQRKGLRGAVGAHCWARQHLVLGMDAQTEFRPSSQRPFA